MGGDRDGNPNVTASVTREVLLLARWMAADLFLRDIDHLAPSCRCSRPASLREQVGDSAEPYRAVLKQLRDRLRATRLGPGVVGCCATGQRRRAGRQPRPDRAAGAVLPVAA
jgi:phosphoenolpyruvate carboxylase